MDGRSPRPTTGRRHSRPALLGLVLGLVAAAAILAGCGGDEEPELTFEQRLTLLEGKTLTPAEVAERASVGEALCDLDEAVLDHVWVRLDEDQLDFQDLVFSMLCPDRAVFYAGHTGRYVTEEAEESGVVTSTSRPTTTVTTVGSTTRPLADPTSSSTSGPGGTDETDGTDVTPETGSTTASTTPTTARATSTLVTSPRQTSGTPTT